MNDIDRTISPASKIYDLREFLLESHEEQSNGQSRKWKFFVESKLVHFKTQVF